MQRPSVTLPCCSYQALDSTCEHKQKQQVGDVKSDASVILLYQHNCSAY
jgi:hypothetical protein